MSEMEGTDELCLERNLKLLASILALFLFLALALGVVVERSTVNVMQRLRTSSQLSPWVDRITRAELDQWIKHWSNPAEPKETHLKDMILDMYLESRAMISSFDVFHQPSRAAPLDA